MKIQLIATSIHQIAQIRNPGINLDTLLSITGSHVWSISKSPAIVLTTLQPLLEVSTLQLLLEVTEQAG